MQQVRQGVHQLQPYAIAAFDGHPHADPHIGATVRVGQDIPGGTDVLTVILSHRKLRDTAAACIIVVIQLRTVDEGQTHIKIGVDKIDDRLIFAQTGQAERNLRQWPNLPSPAALRR